MLVKSGSILRSTVTAFDEKTPYRRLSRSLVSQILFGTDQLTEANPDGTAGDVA